MPPEIGALMTMLISLSPFFITVFLILQSFVKNNLQGVVYLCGMILAQMIGYLSRPLFGNMGVRPDIVLLESGQKYIQKSRACNIVEDPWFSMYSCPSFHALFHVFTIVFVYSYEIYVLGGIKNMGLFITLLSFYVLDGMFRVLNGCITMVHWVIGTFFGFALGLMWWFIVYGIDERMVYNSYISNKSSCKVTNQNFNCKMEVWKWDPNDPSKSTKLTDTQVAALTPNQWKDAMANQAVGNPIASDTHKHRIPSTNSGSDLTSIPLFG